jgi:GNAT superfamily N-acetyltransferase
MPDMPDLRFRRHDAQGALALRDTVALIYREAYYERISSGDPFYTETAFMRLFESHTRHPSLDFVIAYIGGEPVGQIWGFPVDQPTIAAAPGDLARDGDPRTGDGDSVQAFALCEIMVRKPWTGQGIAHALHDELLAARTEPYAELYVRPANATAYRAYLRWGWHKAGQTRPNLPDAPIFDVLHLPLPLRTE